MTDDYADIFRPRTRRTREPSKLADLQKITQMPDPPRRPSTELRAAQDVLAGVAVGHPSLGTAEARRVELGRVLDSLGLLRRFDDPC